MVVQRRQLLNPAARDSAQALERPGERLERDPAALVRQRDDDVGLGALRERLERLPLELGEVVEPVDEDRRATPALGLVAQPVERAPREEVRVNQSRGFQALAI